MCKTSKLKSKEEVLLVAQEIAFAKALAANDKTVRNRALKKLRKWFSLKSQQQSRFTEKGLMRIWKGLFYCVYMSDKPLVQEDVVDSISNLIHCFEHREDAQKFVLCFFRSISQAWYTLDGHRIDKYLMLIRRFLRQILEYLYTHNWNDDYVDAFCGDLYKSFGTAPVGLNLHLTEIYLEEVAKVGRGELESKTVLKLLTPFAKLMAESSDTRLIRYILDYIFLQLIRQSDEGIKYGAKFEVWKQMGFPEGDIDVIQEASDEELDSDESMDDDDDLPDSEEAESALDPRAGNVDVLLPPIDFNPRDIRDFLFNLTKQKDTTTKARNNLTFLLKKYDKFIEGKYPLGIHKCEVPEYEDEEEIINKTAIELLKEDVEFSNEKKLLKKGGIGVSSPAVWEVSTFEDSDVGNKGVSNVGNWEIKRVPKRKTNSYETMCGNMKKIKITSDDSLAEPSETDKADLPENVHILSSETNQAYKGVLRPVSTNSQKFTKLRKKNSEIAEMLLKINSKIRNELLQKRKQRLEKIEQAKIEWGLNHKWDTEKEEEIVIPFSPTGSTSSRQDTPTSLRNTITPKRKTPGSGKKVEFELNKNSEQGEHDYQQSLKKSPCIPFDADKKPVHGVLKTTPLGSPINPFYTEANT